MEASGWLARARFEVRWKGERSQVETQKYTRTTAPFLLLYRPPPKRPWPLRSFVMTSRYAMPRCDRPCTARVTRRRSLSPSPSLSLSLSPSLSLSLSLYCRLGGPLPPASDVITGRRAGAVPAGRPAWGCGSDGAGTGHGCLQAHLCPAVVDCQYTKK